MSSKGRKGKGNKRNAHRAPKFVTSAEEMAKRDEQEGEFQKERKARRKAAGADDEESSEEENFEDMPDINDFKKLSMGEGETETKKKGKAQAQNHSRALKVKDLKNLGSNTSQEPRPMTRREREEIEKQRAAAEYKRRHDAGETDEAKKDLARLAEVKARRDAEKKKKEDEKAAKDAESAETAASSFRVTDDEKRKKEEKKEREKKAKKDKKAKKKEKEKKAKKEKEEDSMFDFDLSSDSEEEGGEKLEARDIKKMNPTQCKEHLKRLGLPIQGNKKDLQARLIDHFKK